MNSSTNNVLQTQGKCSLWYVQSDNWKNSLCETIPSRAKQMKRKIILFRKTLIQLPEVSKEVCFNDYQFTNSCKLIPILRETNNLPPQLTTWSFVKCPHSSCSMRQIFWDISSWLYSLRLLPWFLGRNYTCNLLLSTWIAM